MTWLPSDCLWNRNKELVSISVCFSLPLSCFLQSFHNRVSLRGNILLHHTAIAAPLCGCSFSPSVCWHVETDVTSRPSKVYSEIKLVRKTFLTARSLARNWFWRRLCLWHLHSECHLFVDDARALHRLTFLFGSGLWHVHFYCLLCYTLPKCKTNSARLLELDFLNPLRTKLYVSFKDLVHTAQKTRSASVIKTDKLLLYREKNAVCSEIHAKHINALWAEHRISDC